MDEQIKKEPTQEELNKEFLERKIEVTKRYVKPHNKVSRPVTNEDIPRVLEEGQIMRELCLFGNGFYSSAFAVAHPQIDDKDPLAFYVDIHGQIHINPVITRHSNYLVDKKEGCLSFPEEPMINVKRWHKIEYDYQTLIWEGEGEDKKTILSPVIHEGLSGEDAQIVQHEVDHLMGKYIYPQSDLTQQL